MIRLLFCDLDGTLWEDKNGTIIIKDDDIQSIKRLIDNGIKFAIATGRVKDAGKIIKRKLSIDNLDMICLNGSFVYQNDKIVKTWTYKFDLIINLYNELKNEADLIIASELENNERIALLKNTYDSHYLWKNVKIIGESDFNQFIDKNVLKTTIIIKNESDRDCILRTLKVNGYELKSIINQLGNIELVAPNVSKGDAIVWYCQNNSMSLNEVAFIGDDLNDIEAINYVNYSYAMINAKEIVKNEAYKTVQSVTEAINDIIKMGV